MSRKQKMPKKAIFFRGTDFRPLQKKIEVEMLIFLLLLAYYKLSEIFKNLKLSSVHLFLGSQFTNTNTFNIFFCYTKFYLNVQVSNYSVLIDNSKTLIKFYVG